MLLPKYPRRAWKEPTLHALDVYRDPLMWTPATKINASLSVSVKYGCRLAQILLT